jgi:signal transduction histidine kinase/ligand-binding sensor domain-containing protein
MRVFHALCVVAALIASAGASTPRLDDITEYFRTSLSPRQGAPTVVNALAQTSDGYLWVATPTGLYRFDGVRFDRIDSVGTVRLLGEGIATLVATRSGSGLWIGYEYGGASFIEGDTLRNYPLESGLPRGTVKGLAVGTDGTVWAGTSRGLARFDGQRWADVTDALGLPSPYIEQVLADKTGNLWILARDKVALLRPGSPHVHVYAIPGDNVFQEDPAGRVWTMQTTPACLYLLDPTRDDAPPCRPLPPDSFALWLVDQSGNLWVSDTAEHMRVLPIPSEGSAPTAQSTIQPTATRPFVTFSSGEPNCALQDREGNVWLGTPVGLEQMRVSRLRNHGPFAKIVVLGAGNHNSLWVGTTHSDRPPGQDFFQLDRGVMVPYAGGPTMITGTYRDSTGALWVGGYGRLWKLEDREWKEIPAPPELSKALLAARARTQSIARDTSGALWLSVAQAGLFRLEAGQWQRVLVPGIPPSEYPSAIYADANGPVWLGYPHARIATLTHGTWRLYTEKDGITVGSVQALSKVNNEIWAGGDRGLARIRAGRFGPLPTLNALGGVTGLLQTKSGDLWLSTAAGAVHIAQQELGRLDGAPGRTPSYQTFDFLDGMPGIAPALRPMPSVLQSDDGRIWFEANNSFASIDPTEHIRNTLPPTVIIRSITDDGRLRNSKASLATFPNVRNVAIEYTATSLSIPSRVRFKYRLEGFEQAWQDVGTRRTAYYNNLPPGRYAFHVMAANEDGVWNAQGAVVSLIVPPLFYQTFLFRALCLAILVLLIGALFSARLRQVTERQRRRLEQRMADRLNERTRIARELHDSLLQGFQGLMFRLQAVRLLLPERPVDAASVLDSALGVADQAIYEGRDAIQNLRSSTFDDHDLPAALGTLGAELSVGIETQSPPEYRVVVEGRPRELVPVLRDDIYRIVREAVRNAYQHANAKHIETEVTFGERELRVRVRDDGIGVDPQILIRGQRAGHWGLPGMRERSESFGGQLDVWSEKNAGTEIELRISAHIAYARPPISISRRIRSSLEHYSMRLRPNIRASTDHAPGPNMAKARPSAPATTDNEVQR